MATTTDPNSLQCQLCSNLYTDPLMLSCLHSFCKKCLSTAGEQQGVSDGQLKCSTCKTNSIIPLDGVSAFPQNLWLAHQVEVAQYTKKMHSGNSIPCERCVKRNSGSAVVFCCQCCLCLCQSCKEDHQWWRETVQHKLVPVGEGKKTEKYGNNMPQIAHKPMYCSMHTDEKLKFYCQNCEILSCRDCILLKHSNHKISHHGEVVEEARSKISNNFKGCTEVIESLDNAISNGEKVIQRIKTRKQEIDGEIEKAFSAFKTALAERRKALLNDADEIANSKIICVQLESFQKLKDELEFAYHFAQDSLETHKTMELLSTKKTIVQRLKQCMTEFQQMSCDIKEDDIFKACCDTAPVLESISKFGAILEIEPSLVSIEFGLAIPLATVGKERKFKLALPDSKIDPFKSRTPIQANLMNLHDRTKQKVVISAGEKGTATLSCIPDKVGEYQLSVCIGGIHIQNSPYQIQVKQQRNYSSPQCNFTVNRAVQGVAIHTNGDVYVSDTGGNYSSPQCNFTVNRAVQGVAIHTNGDVYVSDTGGYISLFNANGTLQKNIGSPGAGNGQLQSPFGLTITGDILYVVDSGNNRVQKFTIAGEYIGQFGQGQLSGPWGITHNGKGQLLVADYNNQRVQIFNANNGSLIQTISCGSYNPSDVAVDNEGNIHVTYYNGHIVQKFSHDGKAITTYANPNGYFQYPQGIAIDDLGFCFITGQYSSQFYLHVLDSTCNQVNRLSGFSNPQGVAIDKEGYIYIATYGNNRVVKY